MVLVTGASGMIGRAVARELAVSGCAVLGHDRSVLDFETAGQAAYDELVRGCDAIVHCAALVHDRQVPAARYRRLNIAPTERLIDAAVRAGVNRFVLLSTTSVYGPGPFYDAREDGPLDARTPYAASKLRCEASLRASAIPARVVLRPALVFGEGDRGNVLALLRAIARGRYVHMAGNAARKSIVSAQDVARACLRCLAVLPQGMHILNVANRAPVGVVELADTMAQVLGRPRPRALPARLMRGLAATLEAVLGAHSPLTAERLRILSTTTTCAVDRLAAATGFVPSVALIDALSAEVRWARGCRLLP